VEQPALLSLMAADGVVVRAQGRTARVGIEPDDAEALLRWAAGTGEELVATDSLGAVVPGSPYAGALVVNLADGDAIVWLRREVATAVDWGGDPHNKAIARLEGDEVRLSPRK